MRFLFVFLILLCSCSSSLKRSLSSVPTGDSSCFSLMARSVKIYQDQKKLKEKYARFNQSTLNKYYEMKKSFPKSYDPSVQDEYLTFVNTLFSKDMARALEELPSVLRGEGKGKFALAFVKRQKKFKSYDIKTAKKLKKKYPEKSEEAITRLSRIQGSRYRKIINGCHTKGITQEHKAGGKAFTLFTMGISSTSSGAFYTYSSSDDEDFLSRDFFGKLGYEMAADGIWAFLASVIFKDPTGSFLGKSLKMYMADNTLVAADAFTWEALFGEGEEAAKAEIERLLKDKDAQEELLKLNEALQRESFYDLVKEKFASTLGTLRERTDLTDEELDLEDPNVQDDLIRAALISMYEGEKGELSLGSYGLDRYAYYSVIGVPFMFLDGLVSISIYQTMCMAPLNPKMAVLKSALIFSAYSVFYDMINYPLREKMINQ